MWPTSDRPEHGIFVSDQVDALRKTGVHVDVFHFAGGSPLSYLRAAVQLRRQPRVVYDVVHAHFGLSAWVALAAKAKVRAVTFHGTDLAHPRSRRISLAALRFIDLPAAASPDLAEDVPSGAARRPVAVLPCGLSMERFNATDKMIARTSLGLSANDLIYLLPSDPTRPEKRSDRAQVIAHANQAKLVTLGATPPLEVATWISAADLVLIPSDREGFGLALLEALACEKPVLSTPNGIAPAAVDGVEGAESLAWDEAVWTVAADRLSQLSNTTGGRSSAGRWSSEVCAADVVDAWREALAAG